MVEPSEPKKRKIKLVEPAEASITGGNPMCIERLKKEKREAKDILKKEGARVSFAPQKEKLIENLQIWNVTFTGRPGTPYEGKLIKGELRFPDYFPHYQPKFVFSQVKSTDDAGNEQSSTFQHVNVYGDGSTCIDILNPESFVSTTTTSEMLRSLEEFLYKPNPESAANKRLERLFTDDRKEYDKVIEEQAKKLPPAK